MNPQSIDSCSFTILDQELADVFNSGHWVLSRELSKKLELSDRKFLKYIFSKWFILVKMLHPWPRRWPGQSRRSSALTSTSVARNCCRIVDSTLNTAWFSQAHHTLARHDCSFLFCFIPMYVSNIFFLFFFKYAEELHIIVLRRRIVVYNGHWCFSLYGLLAKQTT